MVGRGFVHNPHPAEIGSDLIAYLNDFNGITKLFCQP